MRHLLSLAVLLGACAAAFAQASPHAPAQRAQPQDLRRWRIVGDAPLSAGEVMCPYLEVSFDGTPYVAYQDFLHPYSRLSLRRWSDPLQSWLDAIPQGSGSVAQSWYNRMTFGRDGTLFLAAREYQQTTAVVHTLSPTTGAWTYLPSGASPGEAHYTDIVLLPDGSPVVVAQDRTSVPVDMTVVRRFDGTQWRTLGGGPISASTAAYQSLAVSPAGVLFCAWSDQAAGGRPVVKRWNPVLDQWSDAGTPGFSNENAANLVVRVGPDESVWVAWVLTTAHIAVRKLVGEQWVAVGGDVDGGDAPIVATENWRQWLCLRFDAQGRPWTAYQAQNQAGKAVVKRFENGAWTTVGSPYFTPAAADYLTFTLGPGDTPWVCFRDGATRRAMAMVWR